eukprot:1842274-Prymnesium_polylepis.1
MWVLAGDVEPALPTDIVQRAKADAKGKEKDGTPTRNQMVGEYKKLRRAWGTYETPQILFDENGRANRYTMAELQQYTLKKLQAGSLRCQFKSRNEFVEDGFFGREAARSRATAATCDGWAISAGGAISLLVFNYPYVGERQGLRHGGGELIEQHNRWWPVVELDLPTWWRPEAAGSGIALGGTLSQKGMPQRAGANVKANIMGDVVFEPAGDIDALPAHAPSATAELELIRQGRPTAQ